ncbi:MAG: phosphotransferase [Acidobacteriia bacterium]|nr:phosphotransferase [Terriglobia bacterium]
MIPHDPIPQEKSVAVTRGLREAFGVTEIEDVRRITKGHNFAFVFRIVVQGRAYLLRIMMRKNPMLGPEREFTCMKAAAEAGLAPQVRYTNLEDQIAITDFVEEAPFPAAEALVRMPATLRALHAVPPFPQGVDHLDTTCMFLLHPGAARDGFLQKFQAAHVLSQTETEELFGWHAQLAAAYSCHERDMVSSHNDLFKPDNILFDGRRVWLVDWEAAFRNDRYADLAVVADLVVANDAEEEAYLQEYFGRPPDEFERARFFLMQQLVHLFYAMAFLWLGSSGEPVNRSEKIPEFQGFQRRLWAGEVNLADKETKTVYGRVHWEQLGRNMRQARFGEALKIVSG